MKRTIFILFVLLSVGSLYAFKGHQQTSPQLPPRGLVNLDVNRQDVRVAIRSLFKAGNLSYTIAPAVQGQVTAQFHNYPFADALANMLGQVNATYHVQAGVYNVVKSDGEVVMIEPLNLDFQNADVRVALRKLFMARGASFVISPDVQGNVTVTMRNTNFEAALQNLLRQVDATYRVEGGGYDVVRKDGDPALDVSKAAAITIEGKYVYIVLDRNVYKLTKDDMKVVSKRRLP